MLWSTASRSTGWCWRAATVTADRRSTAYDGRQRKWPAAAPTPPPGQGRLSLPCGSTLPPTVHGRVGHERREAGPPPSRRVPTGQRFVHGSRQWAGRASQHRVTGDTIAEVKAKRAKMQTELASGVPLHRGAHPVQDVRAGLDRDLRGTDDEAASGPSRSPTTRRCLEQHAIPFFGPQAAVRDHPSGHQAVPLGDGRVHRSPSDATGSRPPRPVSASTVASAHGTAEGAVRDRGRGRPDCPRPVREGASVVRRPAPTTRAARTIRALTDDELALRDRGDTAAVASADRTARPDRPPDRRGARAGMGRRRRAAPQRPATTVSRQHRRPQVDVRGPLDPAVAIARDLALAGAEGRAVERRPPTRVLCHGSASAGRSDPTTGAGVLNDRNVFGRVMKPAAQAAGVPWPGFHTLATPALPACSARAWT